MILCKFNVSVNTILASINSFFFEFQVAVTLGMSLDTNLILAGRETEAVREFTKCFFQKGKTK